MSGFKLSDASSPPTNPVDQPLGLTVHSLPSPPAAAVQDAVRTRSGRWKMIAVMLICAAPVVASYFTYYVIRPDGRRNFGELVDPQRPLPDLTATTLDGQPRPLRGLKDQWLLVSVSGGACDAACQQHLYLQRQIREGLGKDKDRLDWVWLIADDAAVSATLAPALTQATVLRVPAQALARWLAPTDGHQLADQLYLVDPMGNWMMRFPSGMDAARAAKAKRDIERLMRASNAWDKAGRPGDAS